MRSDDEIDRYVRGDLSAEEYERFETEMLSDPALRSAVEEMRTLILGIETDVLRSTLSEIIHEDSKATRQAIVKQIIPPKKKNTQRWWALAASLLLLAAATYYIIWPTSDTPYYQAYYTVDPGLPTPMSATDDFSFFDAMVDFKNEKYELAAEKWEELLAQNPMNDTLIYYLGSAQLASGKSINAAYHLAKLIDDTDSPFQKKARWYWSLCQLALKNRTAVIEKWKEWDFPTALSDEFRADELWQEMLAR